MRVATAIALVLALFGTSTATTNLEAQLPQDGFTGNWENVDPTAGPTKVMVWDDAGTLHVRAWGQCEPTDCDWGAVPLHLIGSSIADQSFERAFATWEEENTMTHLIMRFEGRLLVVETVRIFADGSGRSNYWRIALLRRSRS